MIYQANCEFSEEQLRKLSASSPAFCPLPTPNLTPQTSPSFFKQTAHVPSLASVDLGQYKQEPVLLEGPHSRIFGFEGQCPKSDDGQVAVMTCFEEMKNYGSSGAAVRRDEGIDAYCRYVAGKVAEKTGTQIAAFTQNTRFPQFASRRASQDASVFIVSGQRQAVSSALDLLAQSIGLHVCTFKLAKGHGSSDLVERIDPSRSADLSIDEDLAVLEARLSFRQDGVQKVLMACRREVYHARGNFTSEINIDAALLASLIGPSINKTCLQLNLQHGVIIDLPTPILRSEAQVRILVSGEEENVKSAIARIQSLGIAKETTCVHVEEELIRFLMNSPQQYLKLQGVCQEWGCVAIIKAGSIELLCGSVTNLQAALKKLYALLYDYQRVIIELDEETVGLKEEVASVVKSLGVTANIELDKSCKLIISGLKNSIERAIECLSHLLLGHAWIRKIVWSLAVPHQVREFVSGKKDGKLVKIMRETDVLISLAQMSDNPNAKNAEHLLIRLEGESILNVLTALGLLRGELPAETTFHVPEAQHKRLIGHGGKVIQQVMKKHAVYVKFLNASEAWENAFGSKDYDPTGVPLTLDNVVVRTPAKNGAVLETVKEEILAMAEHEETPSNGKKEIERRSLKISKMALVHISEDARRALLKIVEQLDGGLSMKRGWLEDGLLVLKLNGPSSKIDGAITKLQTAMSEPDYQRLFGSRSEAPSSPTLTISSSKSNKSSVTSWDLFKHFNTALYPRPISPGSLLDALSQCQSSPKSSTVQAESNALPSPPGAPGSGRSPTLHRTSSPVHSEWSSGVSTLSWSSPGASPRITKSNHHPLSMEEELMAASRIMDDYFFGEKSSGSNKAGKTLDVFGPSALNTKADPIIANIRRGQWTL